MLAGLGAGVLFQKLIHNDNGLLAKTDATNSLEPPKIYGIRFDITNPDTKVERIEAAIGKNNTYAIGHQFAMRNTNDFDSIYPWSDMKLCNLRLNAGVKSVIYQGESGFTRDGSNGDVMVEIPKFHSMRKREGNIETWAICAVPAPGFTLDPLFLKNGVAVDKAYIAAYQADSNHFSKTNSKPFTRETVSESIQTFLAKGMMLYDVWAWLAIQRLVLIEFADRNIQQFMNGYGDLVYATNPAKVQVFATNANTIRLINGTAARKFAVGQTISISEFGTETDLEESRVVTNVSGSATQGWNITFTGSPVTVTANVSTVYHSSQLSGSCDGISYHTGRPADANIRQVSMKYRHMENLWGNAWNRVAGIAIKNLNVYIAKKESDYVNHIDTWNQLSYQTVMQSSMPTTENIWVVQHGFDSNNPLVPIPVLAGAANGGSSTAFFPAGYYAHNVADTEYVGMTGGGWDHLNRNSPFTIRFWTPATVNNWLYGSRAMYRG